MTNLSRGQNGILLSIAPFTRPLLLAALAAWEASGSAAITGPAPTANVVRQTKIPGTQAPPLPPRAPKASVARASTNGVISGSGAVALTNQLKREIVLTETGAKAVWGRVKAYFPADLGEDKPISLVAADGKVLSFHPAFLALENRTNSQLVVLGAFTNSSVGTIVGENTIVWSNVCGSAGPDMAIE